MPKGGGRAASGGGTNSSGKNTFDSLDCSMLFSVKKSVKENYFAENDTDADDSSALNVVNAY